MVVGQRLSRVFDTSSQILNNAVIAFRVKMEMEQGSVVMNEVNAGRRMHMDLPEGPVPLRHTSRTSMTRYKFSSPS